MIVALINPWHGENNFGGIQTIARNVERGLKLNGVQTVNFKQFSEISEADAKKMKAIISFSSPFKEDASEKRRWREIKRVNNNVIIVYYTYYRRARFVELVRNFILRRYVNKIVVVSPRMKEMYLGIKSKVIMPPVAEEFFKIFKKRNPKKVVYLGRLDEGKGEEEVRKIKGVKIGGKPSEVLRIASVLFLPYRYLSKKGAIGTVDTPLLVLEAMAAGVPVLTSNVGGLSEILPGECVFERKEEIGEKLEYLKQNFYKVGNKLNKISKELKFDLQSIGKEYLEFIKDE